MKRTFLLFGIILAPLFSFNSYGQQTFELPQDIQLKEKEDYAKYESTVVGAAKWLEETDIDQYPDKHRRVNEFVMKWVEGSPTVNIDINETLAAIYGRNQQLLIIYMAVYSKYAIEHKDSFSKFSACKTALQSIIKVYKKGIYIVPTREMDKVINMSGSDLDSYILDRFTNTVQA